MNLAERLGLEGLGIATTGEQLAIQCRLVEGSRAAISEGAVRLGDWLLDPETPRSKLRGLFGHLSADLVRRLLADAVEPADGEGATLEGFSGGQVLPVHWGIISQRSRPAIREAVRAGKVEMKVATGGRRVLRQPPMAAPPQQRAPEPGPARDGLLSEKRGRIGEVPSGPLFTAVDDPLSRSEFVLAGCGLAIWVDAARAQAMRDALDAGLAGLAGR